MNIVEYLVKEKIAKNNFHAAGILNVLECIGLENDDQRIERCKLYVEWKKYLDNSKEFTNKKNAKMQARKNAIMRMVVPELPMLEYEPTHTEILEALADGG